MLKQGFYPATFATSASLNEGGFFFQEFATHA